MRIQVTRASRVWFWQQQTCKPFISAQPQVKFTPQAELNKCIISVYRPGNSAENASYKPCLLYNLYIYIYPCKAWKLVDPPSAYRQHSATSTTGQHTMSTSTTGKEQHTMSTSTTGKEQHTMSSSTIGKGQHILSPSTCSCGHSIVQPPTQAKGNIYYISAFTTGKGQHTYSVSTTHYCSLYMQCYVHDDRMTENLKINQWTNWLRNSYETLTPL